MVSRQDEVVSSRIEGFFLDVSFGLNHFFFFLSSFVRSIQSVAVSSFVGHVLGIGDRHCSNILVHQSTGEVVHIDFGVVFEQGKLLSAPELVPFRLTRNIVDGLGPAGTEGAFTSVAEETLTTLRNNSDSLLTILSVRILVVLQKVFWCVLSCSQRKHDVPLS
jgi:phosphatidylinositol kinase/protein kinase (PI-3  family)